VASAGLLLSCVSESFSRNCDNFLNGERRNGARPFNHPTTTPEESGANGHRYPRRRPDRPAALLRPALRRDDVVVAVASRRGAQGYADRFGIERAYDSYAELLADPDLDLVYNALPPSLHAQWSIAALEAGKHVLCEKPFTRNAAEAERVVMAAERSGRRAIEAFHDHYHPLSAWVRNFLAAEGLGAVRRAEAIFNGATPFDRASIRHDPALGGGALMDLGCYPIHWLRTALRAEPLV
jgi:predicted dehydrogenase